MDLLGRARGALSKAEDSLRELVSEAAAKGDYDSVQLLADWAKQLTLLRASGPAAHVATSGEQPTSNGTTRRESVKRRKGAKAQYPRFGRNGDLLVKVSWSKKKKAEYEHKAPRALLGALLLALDKAGARHRPVTTEAMFPLRGGGNSEVPSYQAYMTLALLRHADVVETHGRAGYKLQIGTRTPEDVAKELWDSLPTAR